MEDLFPKNTFTMIIVLDLFNNLQSVHTYTEFNTSD